MSNKKQSNTQNKKSNTKIPSKPVKLTSHTQENKTTTHSNNAQYIKKPFFENLRNWLIVFLTCALAFFTFKLYLTTARSIEIAQQSIALADSSLAVTKQMIAMQERFAKIENRAYVIIKDGYVGFISSNSRIPSGYVEFENVGKTPAKEMEMVLAVGCDTSLSIEKINELLRYKSDIMISKRDFGPNAPKRQEFPVEHKLAEEYPTIISGKLKLFGFVNIEYADIFGDRHFTHFCCVYNPETGKSNILPIYNDSN